MLGTNAGAEVMDDEGREGETRENEENGQQCGGDQDCKHYCVTQQQATEDETQTIKRCARNLIRIVVLGSTVHIFDQHCNPCSNS
jgi:hypothetical protein